MSENTINIACLLAWGFLFILPICYIFFKWQEKYNALEGYFSERSIKLYYKLFKPAVKPTTRYKDHFKKEYQKSYGKRNFIVPFVFFGLISAIGIYLIDRTLIHLVITKKVDIPLPPIAISAFLGAYFYIGFDQIQKFRSQYFTLYDVHRWSFRFLIAIPLGYAFSYVVKEPIGIPVAFFLGAFPLKTLMIYSRRFTRKYLKLGDESEIESSELENLQGIDKSEAERLQDEGITNVLQLAYADPLNLAMRSALDFLYIVDIKAQALLWIYLGDKIKELRKFSLRSAHEAWILDENLKSDDLEIKKMGKENLSNISKHLEISELSFKKTLYEITSDPHTCFLIQIWGP